MGVFSLQREFYLKASFITWIYREIRMVCNYVYLTRKSYPVLLISKYLFYLCINKKKES